MNEAANQAEPRYCYDHPHPAVTTDVAAFSIFDGHVHLLLIRRGREPFRGCWALPGGFLDMDEDLEQCAARELMEETGLAVAHLEQLRTFGRPGRDPRERVVSIAYYALIPPEGRGVKAASDASDAAWFPVDHLPHLAFDHDEIIRAALERLREKPGCSDIAFQLLPETFTLGDLQEVYEILTGGKVDKRGFRKWALDSDLIEETGGLRRRGRNRPAQVYRLKDREQVNSTR